MRSPYTGNSIKLPATEIFKTIPEFFGLRVNEEPKYEVIHREGQVEVRRYHRSIVASVRLEKPFREFREEAFKRLASYIFGENRDKTKMHMTAPVLQASADGQSIAMTSPVLQARNGSGAWTMSFILPEKFLRETPPEPLDPAISIESVPPRTLVAFPYRGNATEAKREKSRLKLESWLKSHGEYRAKGEVFWAQYDAPFIIPFFKRNDALVEVSKKS